ncbi:importin subunit alpha-9 [Tanacetum coccineum]
MFVAANFVDESELCVRDGYVFEGCLLRLPMVCSFVAKSKSNGVGFDGGLFFVTAIGDEPGITIIASDFDLTFGLYGSFRCNKLLSFATYLWRATSVTVRDNVYGVKRKLQGRGHLHLEHSKPTEVAAMADVLHFASFLSLIYVGVLSLPAQRSGIVVENAAKQRRRQHVVSVVKERREATFRTKRLCRDGVSVDMDVASYGGMLIEEEPSVLDAQMGSAVEELKLAVSFESEFLFVEIALKRGVMPLLGQCLKFGSEDKQLLEAARCLTNIAGGKSEETRAFLPTLPLLIAHLGGLLISNVYGQVQVGAGSSKTVDGDDRLDQPVPTASIHFESALGPEGSIHLGPSPSPNAPTNVVPSDATSPVTSIQEGSPPSPLIQPIIPIIVPQIPQPGPATKSPAYLPKTSEHVASPPATLPMAPPPFNFPHIDIAITLCFVILLLALKFMTVRYKPGDYKGRSA